MRRFLPLSFAALLLAGVAVASSGGARQAEARWVITDLGTLPGTSESHAVAINEQGLVVSVSEDDALRHPFLWQKGRMSPLGTQDLWVPQDPAINDRGEVIWTGKGGHAFLWHEGKTRDLGRFQADALNERGQIVGARKSRALLWQTGNMRDLGTLGGESSATAINERGQVVGWSEINARDTRYGNRLTHAFLWRGGKMIDLGTLPGRDPKGRPWTESFAWEITDRGEVLGSCRSSSNSQRSFLWRDGTMIDLGTLGGRVTDAYDINEHGQVVGESETSTGRTHAFLWEKGRMTDLGTLGSDTPRSVAVAINDRRQVVGMSESKSRKGARAFVWENGTMTFLGTLPGVRESAAVGLNDRGEIVGWSGDDEHLIFVEHRAHAVLWTLKR